MRTTSLAIILLFVAACTTEPGFEYIPAQPKLSENAVCSNIPLGLTSSAGWFDDEGVELSTAGALSRGKTSLNNLCGIKESDRLFKVEQALILDRDYEMKTDKTRYYVCSGTITRSEKIHHPDATFTIALTGHETCEQFNKTYGHKNKPKVAGKPPTTPCERYTACVCALSAAKSSNTGLAELCKETKGLLAGAEPDDASCNTGLQLMRQTATKAYGIPLPDMCK